MNLFWQKPSVDYAENMHTAITNTLDDKTLLGVNIGSERCMETGDFGSRTAIGHSGVSMLPQPIVQ